MSIVQEYDYGSPCGAPKQLDAATNRSSSSELIKRVRKLRWIGLEDEAQRLATDLPRLGTGDSVLATPRDTD
jgi:hypothetical protein